MLRKPFPFKQADLILASICFQFRANPVATASSNPAYARAKPRLLLMTLFALLFIAALRNAYYWQPSHLDRLLMVANMLVLAHWVVLDARERKHPIPLTCQQYFLFPAIASLGYVIWSRGWRGLGILAGILFVYFVIATVAAMIGVVMVTQ